MSTAGTGSAQLHRVVFDCNVWLDVARVVGEPFTWSAFERAVARIAKDPFPHPDRFNDSLRAVAACTSGRFAGSERIEVWTSDHIDDTVAYKASQPSVPDEDGYMGLGWSAAHAAELVDELVQTMVDLTGGDSMGGITGTEGHPPLDHEDGRVFKACRAIVDDDPLARVYCVTNDGDFLVAARDGRLGDHTIVLTPARFVQLVRAARASLSIRGMTAPS